MRSARPGRPRRAHQHLSTRGHDCQIAHAALQGIGQPGLYRGQSVGHPVQDGSEPDRLANGDQECRQSPDADVGTDASRGLDTSAIPLFPRLPGDLDQGRETLDGWPEYKPCLHGLADGMIFGMDRSDRFLKPDQVSIACTAGLANRTTHGAPIPWPVGGMCTQDRICPARCRAP